MAVITTTMDKVLRRHIDVDVFEQAVASVNWDAVDGAGAGAIMNAWKKSSGAQNDSIDFNVVLIAGTWDIEVMHVKGGDHGIISVQIDGVQQGTIDGYASSVSYNNRSTVSGVSISTTGKVTLRLKMTAKNASSSGYYGNVQHIQLRRTA